MNQLSKCCKAPVKVDYGEEGTNCWMCTKCTHPCDLVVEEITLEERIGSILDDWFVVGTEKYISELEANILVLIKKEIADAREEGYREGYKDAKKNKIPNLPGNTTWE